MLYIPEYKSFSTNCVHNTKGMNGTFLSRHLYEFAYDFASSIGNDVMTTAISDYNTQVLSTCTKQYSITEKKFNNLYSDMMQYNNTIQVRFICYIL